MSYDLKDYVTVAERLRQFMKKYPDGSMQLDPVEFREIEGKTWVIGRAYAYRTPDDPRPGIGTAWEVIPGMTPFTKWSEVQNVETSAWGRALAAIGIGIDKGVSTWDEIKRVKVERNAPEDERFYMKQEPHPGAALTGPAARAYGAKKINGKQIGLLKHKLEEKGIAEDQLMPTVNALLGLAGHNPVVVPADLTNPMLNDILDNLDKVQTVEQFVSDTG